MQGQTESAPGQLTRCRFLHLRDVISSTTHYHSVQIGDHLRKGEPQQAGIGNAG